MIRIICVETDAGTAVNAGGPVAINHKTFDVSLPEVEAWLKEQERFTYCQRTVSGIEILPEAQSQPAPAYSPAADAEVSQRYMIEFKLDNGVWWLWGGGHEFGSVNEGHALAARSLKAGTNYRIVPVGTEAVGPFVIPFAVPVEATMRAEQEAK